MATIYVDGTYAVYHNIEAKWATVLPRAKADSIRQGASAINRMKITFGQDMATLAVNGTEIAQVQHA